MGTKTHADIEVDTHTNPRNRRGRRSPEGTRARIVTLTRALIAQKGLSGIKARTIASEAGLSVGTVYNMFGHLDDLVRLANGQTYDSLQANQTKALAAARSVGASPRVELHALADAYLDWVVGHHALWSATLAFNRERQGEAPDWYRAKEMGLLGIIEDALTDFPKAMSEAERHTAARALWSSIHGIVTMAMGARALLIPPDEITAQMRIIVDAVAATLEA